MKFEILKVFWLIRCQKYGHWALFLPQVDKIKLQFWCESSKFRCWLSDDFNFVDIVLKDQSNFEVAIWFCSLSSEWSILKRESRFCYERSFGSMFESMALRRLKRDNVINTLWDELCIDNLKWKNILNMIWRRVSFRVFFRKLDRSLEKVTFQEWKLLFDLTIYTKEWLR